jgi:hypothetical protein
VGLFSQGNAVAITSLQFLRHCTLLASASDTTGAVKLWDVRMLDDPVAFVPAEQPAGAAPPHLNLVPLNTALPCEGQSGVVHLTSDADGALMPDAARIPGCMHSAAHSLQRQRQHSVLPRRRCSMR